jgi:caffeoyl-CoA O-methyltransferase
LSRVSHEPTPLDPDLHRYAIERSRQPEVLARLEAETRELGDVAVMMISPEQGSLLRVLAGALGARRALEVGTFTGYGSISIASGLPADGVLVTCELDEERAAVARRWFGEAGLSERIELRLGPALETLRAMDGEEPFDFAFIDADKESYPDYYEEVLRLLRPGGLVVVDNVFRAGDVIDPGAEDAGVRAIRRLNDTIAADERVDSVMVGVADGITLALKR